MKLYTVTEVAGMLNMSRQGVLWLIQKGRLKAEKYDEKSYIIEKEDIEKCIKDKYYDKEKYVSTSAFAKLIGSSISYVTDKIEKGEITGTIRKSRKILIPIEFLDKIEKPKKYNLNSKYMKRQRKLNEGKEVFTIHIEENEFDSKEYLSIAEVMELLGVSRMAIIRWFNLGIFQKYICKHRIYLLKSDINRFLKNK